MKITDEQWTDIIDRVDLDKDGKIDAKEFVLLCQTLNRKDNLPPKKIRKPVSTPVAATGTDATPVSSSAPAKEGSNSTMFAVIGVALVAAGVFVAYQQGALDGLLKKNKK